MLTRFYFLCYQIRFLLPLNFFMSFKQVLILKIFRHLDILMQKFYYNKIVELMWIWIISICYYSECSTSRINYPSATIFLIYNQHIKIEFSTKCRSFELKTEEVMIFWKILRLFPRLKSTKCYFLELILKVIYSSTAFLIVIQSLLR